MPPVNCNCLRPVPLHPHSHFNHRHITVFAVVAASPSCSKRSISEPVAIVSSDTCEAGKTLTGGEWIERHENLLVTGSTGTGKTWLGCALGHRACRDNRSVLDHRLPRLLETLGLARGDGRYARMLKSVARVQVLILDDWGITPLTAEQRRDLLEIVDDRHGRASTVATSQLPVAHGTSISATQPSPTPCSTAWFTPHTGSNSGGSHCASCAPRKPSDLTRRLAPEPNVAASKPYRHPGWLPSECLAGFDRNRWLVSAESALGTSPFLASSETTTACCAFACI